LPKPSLPKYVTNSRASTPAAGDSVAVELNLATRAWHFYPKGAQVRWRREPQPVHAGVLQSIPEQTKRRRRTGDVKDGEHKAEALIRLPNWRVTRSTPLEDLEVLLAALIRCLGHWSGDLNGVAWCVGGSVAATLASRDAAGDTAVLRFCLCNSFGGCWVGDGQSKIGATCKFHCDGIDVDGVTIDGRFHESIKLSKCTWMKCCYGKKPFGSPPEVPWCRQCECQKNLDRRFAPSPAACPCLLSMIELNSFVLHRKKTAAKADSRGASRSAAKAAPAAAPGRNARRHGGAKRVLPASSCHDCLKKLAQKIPAGGGLPSVLLSNCSSAAGMPNTPR